MNGIKKSPGENGWGVENIPFPEGTAYIQTRWDLCIGCGMCEIACAMYHHGVMNRELSRIRIYRYLTPLPKSVQNVCVQCREEERECQKACPVSPPVIYYDDKFHRMKVDADRCLGSGCAACQEACPASVPRFYPPEYDTSMVCDLCEKDGERKPQCVEICPSYALEFMAPLFPQHLERIHPDEKAECLSRRLYPLAIDKIQRPPEEIWRE
ncbi:MAG: 4Fe-4S dicluster domain-containing protein [Thermodesulfobacteriota bacterium]|nr:4Fe-4S dicluster domain-containing protein [Thermodesulfobacteriota bacterium]